MLIPEKLNTSLLELNNKRERGYIFLLAAQLVTIVYTIVIFQISLRSTSEIINQGYTFVFAIVGMAYTWFTYSMIRHFSQNKVLIRTTFVVFLVSFWTGLTISNPLNPMDIESTTYTILGIVNQAGSLLAFMIIMVFMVRDIFTSQHTIGYRLWGAACIYFNIGFIFSFIYGLVNLLGINELDMSIKANFTGYMHCVNYSYYTLSTLDSPYINASGLFRGIGVLQSLLANLYIVLLIGRLLSKE
jgi:hypothetical protein